MSKDKKVYIFTCLPEIAELIGNIAKHVDGGEEAVFRKGVMLVGLMIRAAKTGCKLAIIDDKHNIKEIIENI